MNTKFLSRIGLAGKMASVVTILSIAIPFNALLLLTPINVSAVVVPEPDTCGESHVYTFSSDSTSNPANIDFINTGSTGNPDTITVSADSGFEITKVEADVSEDGQGGYALISNGPLTNHNPSGGTINSVKVTVKKVCPDLCPNIGGDQYLVPEGLVIIDGQCVEPPVLGCTDDSANNYNPDATEDDGSCTYDVLGCTDDSANNYDPEANVDDGSCTYDVLGCMDETANNYNPDANVDDQSCEYPEPVATIVAQKVVCEDEADLPNWGDGAANINSETAESWVSEHDGCSLEEGWSFQWAPEGTSNPGDSLVGEAGGDWVTFGPTDGNGTASVELSAEDIGEDSYLWFREVMQSGYIPFSGSSNDVSAEVYCNTDVLNYDNFDRIDDIALDETFYCVAFNAPEQAAPIDVCPNLEGDQLEVPEGYTFIEGQCIENEPQICEEDSVTIVSDEETLADGLPASSLSFEHEAWTASIPGAIWIWEVDGVNAPTTTETVTFTRDFNVADITSSAILDIATDNSYVVRVNGTEVGSDSSSFALADQDQIDVTSYIVVGPNTLEIEVTNEELADSTPETNPAGLLFKLTVIAGNCDGEGQPIIMCEDEEAMNYGEEGECIYEILGCMDPEAENYNPDANTDDESCVYQEGCGDGEVLIGDQCVEEVVGCTDPDSSNYNYLANVDDGSCDGNGGSSGSQPNGGSVLGASVIGQVLGESCGLYIDKFVFWGRPNNDVDTVKKVEDFLNRHMALSLPVDGIYGPADRDGVNAFQLKFWETVLTPWVPFGLPTAQTPTGNVYKTTQRMINLVECGALTIPMPQLP